MYTASSVLGPYTRRADLGNLERAQQNYVFQAELASGPTTPIVAKTIKWLLLPLPPPLLLPPLLPPPRRDAAARQGEVAGQDDGPEWGEKARESCSSCVVMMW